MSTEEVRTKYQPRPLENQMQFEEIMRRMNQDQAELNRPLIDRRNEIQRQRELIKIQKQALNQQLSALSIEYREIEAARKAINRPYHDVKNEFCELNPRERFIKNEEQ